MANNYPDGGEQPLGPIERKVLPWIAWAITAFFSGAAFTWMLHWIPGLDRLGTLVVGFLAGAMFALWAIRPWST